MCSTQIESKGNHPSSPKRLEVVSSRTAFDSLTPQLQRLSEALELLLAFFESHSPLDPGREEILEPIVMLQTNILQPSKDLKVLHEFLHVLCNLWPKSSKKCVEPILTWANRQEERTRSVSSTSRAANTTVAEVRGSRDSTDPVHFV